MSILAYIYNKWIDPSDRVIIKHQDYLRGSYHDCDCKMLYVLFQMLVDFVEMECGAIYGPYYFESHLQKLHRKITNLPIVSWFLPPARNIRRGLHHLRWAMKLQDIPSQAQQAKDVFLLYKFWVHTRPRRIDPWIWVETFIEPKRIGNGFDCSPEYSVKLTEAGKIEDQYDKEDQEMLTLLIKIRGGLWT